MKSAGVDIEQPAGKTPAAPLPAGSVIEQGRHGEHADGDRSCEDLPHDRIGAGAIDDVTENRCAQRRRAAFIVIIMPRPDTAARK